MSKLTSPLIRLMGRLSIANKFLLVAAFFAVPLILALLEVSFSLNEGIARARHQQQSIGLLRQIDRGMQTMEVLRDLGVLNYLLKDAALEQRFKHLQKQAHTQLDQISKNPLLPQSAPPLVKSLQHQLDSFYIATGQEAVRIRMLFDNANRFIQQADDLRRLVLNNSGLMSGEQLEVFALLDLTQGDLPPVLEKLGETRVFGSYYLTANYIDSDGIDGTEDLFKKLDQAQRTLQAKLAPLQLAYPQSFGSDMQQTLLHPIAAARDDLDTNLIQAMQPSGDWTGFEQRMSERINGLYDLIDQLLERAQHHLAGVQHHEQGRLVGFLSGLSLLILVFILMFYAAYRSVRENIEYLAQAASEVAAGEFDHPVQVTSQDEMQNLAQAMDRMRVQLQQREAELRRISTTDALTGLYNRKFFDDVLLRETQRALRQQTPLSLLIMDADHFKRINDNYGHQAGDEVLRQIAEVLRHCVTRTSDVLARYGGEELTAILPDTESAGALLIAERIRQRVAAHPVRFEDHEIEVTLSIGLSSLVPNKLEDRNLLVAEADKALYQAKAGGRNRSCVASQKSFCNADDHT